MTCKKASKEENIVSLSWTHRKSIYTLFGKNGDCIYISVLKFDILNKTFIYFTCISRRNRTPFYKFKNHFPVQLYRLIRVKVYSQSSPLKSLLKRLIEQNVYIFKFILESSHFNLVFQRLVAFNLILF
jgi:hypothetical protein